MTSTTTTEPRYLTCPICYEKVYIFVSICDKLGHGVCLPCLEKMACRVTIVRCVDGIRRYIEKDDVRCPLCRQGLLKHEVYESDGRDVSRWFGRICCPATSGAITFRGEKYKSRYDAVHTWIRNAGIVYQCWLCDTAKTYVPPAEDVSQGPDNDFFAFCKCMACWDCDMILPEGTTFNHIQEHHPDLFYKLYQETTRPRRSARLAQKFQIA